MATFVIYKLPKVSECECCAECCCGSMELQLETCLSLTPRIGAADGMWSQAAAVALIELLELDKDMGTLRSPPLPLSH
jgi:hypothetical protein